MFINFVLHYNVLTLICNLLFYFREISRKRKEFEYRIQRRVKEKDDFVHYIAYELALLEDISLRRKKAHLSEKRSDIEYAIAKRLNKIFKQFIYRFQNNIEIYFEYIKFCRSVGFQHAISGIISQMLLVRVIIVDFTIHLVLYAKFTVQVLMSFFPCEKIV